MIQDAGYLDAEVEELLADYEHFIARKGIRRSDVWKRHYDWAVFMGESSGYTPDGRLKDQS